MLVPTEPKIYHIVHVDRLASIISDGYLWSDAEARRRDVGGTAIGLNRIKERRLNELTLDSHPDLFVGDCVPFYFCPRSVMLYIISRGSDPDLDYRGGQGPIVHLEADLHQTVARANANRRRWAITTSNAGSRYFEDYSDLSKLDKLDWDAIQASQWSGERKGPKQAEFLVERSFPWDQISRIGVHTPDVGNRVLRAIQSLTHRPKVEIKPGWYYEPG